MSSELNNLIDILRDFSKERDWEQFHSPKNLSMALSSEVGELLERFQWLSEEDSYLKDAPRLRGFVSEELADIFIYLLYLSDKLGVDLIDAAEHKIQLNKKKYPKELSKGSHLKYTELTKK